MHGLVAFSLVRYLRVGRSYTYFNWHESLSPKDFQWNFSPKEEVSKSDIIKIG